MTAATAHRSFADSVFARLIALAIAVLIGLIFIVYWADDLRTVLEGEAPQIPVLSQQTSVKPANPGLQNCLAERVGDVDKMKAEGVVNDAQYTSFRQRAEELCRAQHPN